MAQRQTIFRALRWDVGIIGIVAISVLLYRVIQDPFFQPASSPTSEGSRPPDRTEGDILLLLPDSPSADATSFEELDCSYGWFNSLWQEYGIFWENLGYFYPQKSFDNAFSLYFLGII